ncbi:hypothetical protein GQ53DRAFT_191187 [Thozetella sp. PMI_491]|nr:hypothetical protein GQ53DRAFT_191187 [Thozetella sp. PMI_491]
MMLAAEAKHCVLGFGGTSASQYNELVPMPSTWPPQHPSICRPSRQGLWVDGNDMPPTGSPGLWKTLSPVTHLARAKGFKLKQLERTGPWVAYTGASSSPQLWRAEQGPEYTEAVACVWGNHPPQPMGRKVWNKRTGTAMQRQQTHAERERERERGV